jgi:ATP-binding cassette subfamily C (CFTR/MRP) protein 1
MGWSIGVYVSVVIIARTYPANLLSLLVLSQGANIVTSLWLSYWTSNKFGYSQGAYIGAYASFGFSQALFMFLFSWSVAVFGTRAGKTMLHRAITRVLRAPMSFFDTTPLGRITNRFSKDIDVLDNTITDSMRMYFITLAMIIS